MTKDASLKRMESDITTAYEATRATDLPPANTRRWVPRRKAQVVAAVERGFLTLEQACARYSLTQEEFRSWQELVHQHGPKGLRVTKLQSYQGRPVRRA